MTHSKVDLAIKGAIAALLVALGRVIVWSMQQHIVHVGDQARISRSLRTTASRSRCSSTSAARFWCSIFGRAWCPPCVEEAPSLNEFAKTFESSGVVVLGVSVDRNQQMYENFVKRFHIAYPTVRDPDENSSYRYGTYQFPESYIIDRNGKVVRKFAGLPERDGQPIPWTDPQLMSYREVAAVVPKHEWYSDTDPKALGSVSRMPAQDVASGEDRRRVSDERVLAGRDGIARAPASPQGG